MNLLLKLVPIAAAAAIALWEIKKNEKMERIHRRGAVGLYLLLAIASGGIAFVDDRDANTARDEARSARNDTQKATIEVHQARLETEQAKQEMEAARKEAADWQSKAALQMNRMEGKMGSDESTQDYLNTMRAVSIQFAGQQTDAAVENFYDSQAERKRVHERITAENAKLILAYRMRFQPVCDLALAKVDDWIADIKKRGTPVDNAPTELHCMEDGTHPDYGWTIVREITFANGQRIVVYLMRGRVADGKMEQQVGLMLQYSDGRMVTSDPVWQLYLGEPNYGLVTTHPNRFDFSPSGGAAPDPLQDAAFIKSLQSSLDQVMGYIVDDAPTTSARLK
jgi:hypothetical protein